ncbi:MAG TPA: HDIG domain-containing protein [Desulfuromonadales bacterium]|nr:HDIG domain-containing protein [Desulfuromonadales bacterium]
MPGITREKALELLDTHVKTPNMRNHCLAAEAVMRALAVRLGTDPDQWGLAGLLHDLDAESTADDMTRHTREAEPLLREAGVSEPLIRAIRMHNEAANDERRSDLFHHALAAGETITGLIVATTLVYPDRKLASVKPKSVRKRMKEKAFAAGVDRGIVMECEALGLSLEEFIEICLEAMTGIAGELGL